MEKPIVVLIDDTADYRILFKQALKYKNVDVVEFGHGRPALEFLKTAIKLPTMVFVDSCLPEISGEEIVREIRADIELRNLKVILASAQRDLAGLATKVGADGYLSKPFELSELYKIVDAG